jgi:exopolyphosphatase/guanosine-5'-triphosphate,3'-diphosphate pyrophosphatase
LVTTVRSLLADDQLSKVDGIGRAIRLAHTLSGSAPGLLVQTRLERKAKTLVLHMPGGSGVFQSETVERRFRGLSKCLGLRGSISLK